MQLIGLLRFCNAFNVPISAFIVDEDINANDLSSGEMEYVLPEENDQMQPNVGYIDNTAKRQPGTRMLRDPLDVDVIKSVVPGLITLRPPTPLPQELPSDPIPKEEKQDVNLSTINRLLDIIADQQQLIKTLTHQLSLQQPGYMVADEIRRKP